MRLTKYMQHLIGLSLVSSSGLFHPEASQSILDLSQLKTLAMASELSQQYTFRAEEAIGLAGNSPEYIVVPNFEVLEVPVRMYHYSADGRLFACALPNMVRIFRTEGAQPLQDLPIANVADIKFSPRGTYLSTWKCPVDLEDGSQPKNLRVFRSSTGEELISFTQTAQDSWDLQYTLGWSKGIVDKLGVEGATSISLSLGLNPSVAVFVAEKDGAPASVIIYDLLSLESPPTCHKTFYKADRSQIKWNYLGTQLLLLTQTRIDNSNANYYGEDGLYLLSTAGNFNCKLTLDKEGPIHDFAWSPNSQEFGVVYGYAVIPAKTVLFDHRVQTIHNSGDSSYNFISFNPQGRLIALAGFRNLGGTMDVFDRQTFTKVGTVHAPDTSYCEWSPDGRLLLTAILSPRLRVDNGVRIYHFSGVLMHSQLIERLYQASWRPIPVDKVAPFEDALPASPVPNTSVQQAQLSVTGASIKDRHPANH
ncbi:eukaryotic translation initiation factor eIF2A-domain-containing protein [Mycena epipterygia]|nr:eukaryotic translation initiation factor eIF2A-domain-containing protein [Mycena epipterygia]